MSVSLDGVLSCAGVVAIEDSTESRFCSLLGNPRRLASASSAASFRDIAELFLCWVLKANLDFGANFARVSWSFSERALMAYLWLVSYRDQVE